MSFPATAKFPASQWDGSSASRSAAAAGEPIIQIYAGPSPDDYSQIMAEVRAMQFNAGAGGGVASLSATSGFMFIPHCAGTPTGVPANVPAGYSAAVYDSTAHKLWIYDAGWKTPGADS